MLAVEACTNADAGFSPSETTPDAGAGAGAVTADAGKGNAGRGGEATSAGNGGAEDAGTGGELAGGGASAGNAGRGGSGSNAGNGGAPAAGAGNGGGGASGSGGGPVNPPECGNQTLEAGEQCDDGNQAPLDGCNASCGFEQSQRIDWLKMQFATTALCTLNEFGSAFKPVVQTVLQASVDARIASGALSMLFAFDGLGDLSGASDSSIALGVMYGSPVAGASYDGTDDLDWWYLPAAGTVNESKKPISVLNASSSASVLTAGPGKIQLPLFSTVPLAMSNALLRVRLGMSSKPLTSTGAPPGHVAAEHLDPALTSFARGGTASDAQAGELCGNLSAASLQNEPVPAAYTNAGNMPCFQGYTPDNTLLDVLIGGCTLGGVGVVVAVTQPDQGDASAPVAGAGAPYRLLANGATKSVTSCRDKNNAVVTLATCLNAAAYSSAFRLTTRRVILK